jgi:hypothetical protein
MNDATAVAVVVVELIEPAGAPPLPPAHRRLRVSANRQSCAEPLPLSGAGTVLKTVLRRELET